jgi:IclR family transcriptional regulator, acetate operon repressor
VGTREATDGEPGTIRAVQRAADVLGLLADAPVHDLGVSEIARALDLPKGTTHRLLVSLASRRLVERDRTDERYRLGPAALVLGTSYLERIDVRSLAREPLRRLVARTAETAVLAVRVDDQRCYLDQVTPARDVKMTVQLGRPAPLHAGGAAKAILASLPDDELERYLGEHPLERYTDRTLTDPAVLRDEVAGIRRRGYATSVTERQLSASSVAAPVRDHEGRLAAVLGVCGPVERLQPRFEEVAAMLVGEARELERRLGGR